MTTRTLLTRLPFLLVLAALLTAVAARSSLARLLPFDAASPVVLAWVFLGIAVALVPALLARQSPLGAAAIVAVPVLAVGAYGASRLDWLRLLKDFGVAEARALDPIRLALGVVAVLVLWALHAADLALRLRERAIERGIDAPEAADAAGRSARRSAEAAGIALAGALGLLGIGILGLVVGSALPTQRAALVAPLLAAGVLLGAAVWLARTRGSDA